MRVLHACMQSDLDMGFPPVIFMKKVDGASSPWTPRMKKVPVRYYKPSARGWDCSCSCTLEMVCENFARLWFDEVSSNVAEKRMINKTYERFLCEFKDRVEFKKYVDIHQRLASKRS